LFKLCSEIATAQRSISSATAEYEEPSRCPITKSLKLHQAHTGFARELSESDCDERGILLVAAHYSLDSRVNGRVANAIDFRTRHSEYFCWPRPA
jgi:hypothetical protein